MFGTGPICRDVAHSLARDFVNNTLLGALAASCRFSGALGTSVESGDEKGMWRGGVHEYPPLLLV